MTMLPPEQVDALRELADVCRSLAIDSVIVGATALLMWIPHAPRLTEDIDVAVALDLDAFGSLSAGLTQLGWHPDVRWEPRWHSRGRVRVDLLPLGPRARAERRIVWPRAETVMRVVGSDRIFSQAVSRELASGFSARVAPLSVLALLKLAAYLDAPGMREKDLGDVLLMLDEYGEDGDRRFGDDILEAGVDYETAGAFLLGQDLQAVCATAEEQELVRTFLRRVTEPDFLLPLYLRRRQPSEGDGRQNLVGRQFTALADGFRAAI